METERENAGRYVLLGEIARGACGIIYRARDLEMGRTVALKKFRHERLGAVARERFLREARLAARLDHPGIVPVYGFGLDGEHPFYTMPMLRGRPLSAALREGPAEIGEVLRVGFQVARALRICDGCPVRQQCLDFAVRSGEKDGIWGGTTPEERIRARRARNRHAVRRTWPEAPAARAS